jgi:hypothetical protein
MPAIGGNDGSFLMAYCTPKVPSDVLRNNSSYAAGIVVADALRLAAIQPFCKAAPAFHRCVRITNAILVE